MGIDVRERYINPYTDFGFKKLFGTKLNKEIKKRLFDQAEIAQFTTDERREYAESVKDYWDYYSTMKTAHKKGRAEGLAEGEAKGRAEERMANARRMKVKGFSAADIAEITGLAIEEIEQL